MLRGRQVMQAKFRRQHPIGPFIVDFFCREARLVVEAEGAPHFPKPLRDRRRDAWLRAAGFVVLRLPNHQILRHPDRVLDRIRRLLFAQLPAPSPFGRGAGGEAVDLPDASPRVAGTFALEALAANPATRPDIGVPVAEIPHKL